MNERVVTVEDEELKLVEDSIDLDLIDFDPTNPRIQFQIDTSLSGAAPTQQALAYALTVGNDQYEKLRDNVECNGGILNPIWIVAEGGRYVVIEGNTRLQVYLDLRDKHPHEPKWKGIPAFLLPHRCSREQINFIRLEAHLFGTTTWDAYEKARELYRLHNDEDYSVDKLSARTKLTPGDIRTHIQAFRDMKEFYLQSYPTPGEHQKFSYFVEFRKSADLKKLVEAGELSLVDFCAWVGQGKFGRGEDVRKLGVILRDPAAKRAFIDFDFEAGLDQLSQKDPGARSPLFEKIEAVISGLQEMPYAEVSEIRGGRHPRKIELLQKLSATVEILLADLRRS